MGSAMVGWMGPPASTSVGGSSPSVHGYCVEVGWLSYIDWEHDLPIWFGRDWIWFWIKNTSVFIPLLIAGQILRRWIPTSYPNWFAPMWLWFVVPNVIVLQPWDWDNTKFFVFWALLGSILVGAVLARMFQRGPGSAIGASGLLGVLGLAGSLGLARAPDFHCDAVQLTDGRGLKVADWTRANTSPTSLFVVADEHNNAIPTLAGRRVLICCPGWLATYVISYYTHTRH